MNNSFDALNLVLEQEPLSEALFKSILTRSLRTERSDFKFMCFATGVYHFFRLREFHDYDIREMLHVVYSFDEKKMQCSVSSRLNQVHLLSPIYNDGVVNPHADLLAIKRGRSFFPEANVSYGCDGTEGGAWSMVQGMLHDFKTVALPWYDERFDQLRANPLLRAGLRELDAWEMDKAILKNELSKQLRKANHQLDRVRNPLFNELVKVMSDISPHEPMGNLRRTALELVELYCEARIG